MENEAGTKRGMRRMVNRFGENPASRTMQAVIRSVRCES